jgi:hypothetical protein
MTMETNQPRSGPGDGLLKTTVLVVLFALIVAQTMLFWSFWDTRAGARLTSTGETGAFHAVTLANGAVYYGRLLEARSGYIKLGDVYYVQSGAADPNGNRDNHLVNRKKNDWHSPTVMVIPNDKVLFVEEVGAQSRIVKLIEQDKTVPQANQVR